jgi:hypothetical protein
VRAATDVAPRFGDGNYSFRMRHESAGGHWVLDSERLTLAGSGATLELEGRERVDGPTSPVSFSMTMHGTTTRNSVGLAMEFPRESSSHPGEESWSPLRLACQVARVDVAPADAILVVAADSACPHASRWSKPTHAIWALQCESRDTGVSIYSAAGIEQVKPLLNRDAGCDPDLLLYREVDASVVVPIQGP